MDYQCLSDKQLVERILEDDQLAVIHLLKVRAKGVIDYIKYNLFRNSYIESDDLVHELFIFLHAQNWKKLREFEFRSKLSTWLSVVAFRYFRKKYTHLVIDNKAFEPLNDQRDYNRHNGVLDSFHAKIDLLDAIHQIKNPKHRLVLYMMEIEGFEPEDMAHKLETTVSNIYLIKSRAKKELQTVLNEDKNYEK